MKFGRRCWQMLREEKWRFQAHPNYMAVWIGSSVVMSQCRKQFNLRGAWTFWSYQNRLFWETRSAAAPDLEWFMTYLNRVDPYVVQNACKERSATEKHGVRKKIRRQDNPIWNHREGAIQLATAENGSSWNEHLTFCILAFAHAFRNGICGRHLGQLLPM